MSNFRVVITKGERTYSVDLEMPEGSTRLQAAHSALQDLIAAQQHEDSNIPASEDFHPNDADRASVTRLPAV